MEPSRPLDYWLTQGDALRRLAIGLVPDEHLAEDLVQATYLDWVRHPPEVPEQPRAWMRVVMRNKLASEAQSRRRRGDRERIAARPESLNNELEVVETNELRACVQRAVRELPEPYRALIAVRYFEGRKVDWIAEQNELPVGTVKARLRRGRELLRERLRPLCQGDLRLLVLALDGPELTGTQATPIAKGAAQGSVPSWVGAFIVATACVGIAALAFATLSSLADDAPRVERAELERAVSSAELLVPDSAARDGATFRCTRPGGRGTRRSWLALAEPDTIALLPGRWSGRHPRRRCARQLLRLRPDRRPGWPFGLRPARRATRRTRALGP